MGFDQIIYNTAIADGMPRPLALCIVAQSKHETNNYSSSIFLDCHNAFGYKEVTSSCPLHPDYQNYNSFVDSTHEITAWIKRRLNEGNFPALSSITSVDQYAQYLKLNGYFGDSLQNYAAGLQRWYTDNIGTGGSIALLLIISVVVFIVSKGRK